MPLLFLMACTGTKRLGPGEKLYTGHKIEMTGHTTAKQKTQLREVIKKSLRVTPNKSILGMRPRVVAWQISQKQKNKKFKNFLQKQGEEPVTANHVKPELNCRYIEAALFNSGIFNAACTYSIVEKKKKFRVIYNCLVHPPYTLNKIDYRLGDAEIQRIVDEERDRLIESGQDYNLDNLKAERERIDDLLKNNGYYYFNPDYLLFKVDTAVASRSVNLELTLKDVLPDKATSTYSIGEISINTSYSLNERDSLSRNVDRVEVDSVIFIGDPDRVKPSVILESVMFRRGQIYSRKKHNITLSRLMTMGTYKFARIKFRESDSAGKMLNARISLTPLPTRSLRLESNLVSKSNDFIGPHLNLNYINRNEFGGAELFNFSTGGSFETQVAGKYKNLFSYSFNSKVEIFFPRFISPVKIRNASSFYVPRTKISLGYSYLSRIAYFDLRSLQFIYGYKWKENAEKEHELNPLNINLTSLTRRTQEFNDLLESNPFIKKSYEEQFITGIFYSYLFNQQVNPNKKNQLYLNPVIETSGNLLSLVNNLTGSPTFSDSPQKFAGVIYSQFARASIDFRHYLNFKSSKLVERLYVGCGRAYGNSVTLPYIRQFFSGGPNSVRAFPINSLGPGSSTLQLTRSSLYLQQGGDIKLEANVEYRFDILKSLKGAVFADAGNTWLMRGNPAIDTPPFSFSESYKEIAVGTGLGLRFDVSFFVLRFDVGMPLRKPWYTMGKRWVINQINFADAQWRGDNLILNVAIGYPF